MLDAGLLGRLEEAAARAFAGLPVAAAYAYGSRVSGRPRPDSDLDVGYRLTSRAGGAALPLASELQVAAVMSEAIGLEVDLRSLDEAPLELRGRVLEEGRRIHDGDPVERVAFERNTLARYHDYKSEFAAMHELRFKSVARRRA